MSVQVTALAAFSEQHFRDNPSLFSRNRLCTPRNKVKETQFKQRTLMQIADVICGNCPADTSLFVYRSSSRRGWIETALTEASPGDTTVIEGGEHHVSAFDDFAPVIGCGVASRPIVCSTGGMKSPCSAAKTLAPNDRHCDALIKDVLLMHVNGKPNLSNVTVFPS